MADITDILPGEIWKPVPSVPGVDVSNMGRVMAVTRPGGGKVTRRKVLTGEVADNGYRRVKIGCANGARHLVHRLVCEAFHGKPFEGATVDHLDGNRLNNAATNLEWVTRSENARRQNADGRGVPKGEMHPLARISNADAASVPLLISQGLAVREIAARFGVSRALIHKIIKGERRGHV